MTTEAEGCSLLEKAFKKRGYAIVRDADFHEGGVHCELDGWDATQRVGFEYLVRSEGDHDDLTDEEQTELASRMQRGELYVLIVDEASNASVLAFAATHFLDEVERRRGVAPKLPAGSRAAPITAKPAKRSPVKKKEPPRKARKQKTKPRKTKTKKARR